ncbi:MAG: glycosyltransferase family 4 protein [Acidimicrobiales bacterium]
MTNAAEAAVRIGYVMTHYPRHSQTFLFNEVATVADGATEIVPYSLNPPDPGDVELPDELSERDRTFYVKAQSPVRIAMAVLRTARRHPGRFVEALGVAVRFGGLDARLLAWTLFQLAEACVLVERVRDDGCRHLHAQFGGPTATVCLLVHLLDGDADRPISWSFTVHGYHEFTEEKQIHLPQKVRQASFVSGVSDHTRSQLMRISAPEVWERLHVARCGVDLDAFEFHPPAVRTGDGLRVLSVGRLSPEKGQHLLVDAAALLARRGRRDITMVFVGDGPSRSDLERRAAGLGDQVEFLGAKDLDEVRAELGRSDAFCLASFAEGIPISIMEAFAVGVPVVATDVGGVSELVVDGVTGRLVPPGSADALADALERLADDPDGAIEMTKAARRGVEERHDLTVTSTAMRALLRAAALDPVSSPD